MRLLQLRDDGELSLVERQGNNVTRYAILSHTWGADNEEVTFRDIRDQTYRSKPGYHKILFCGGQAKQDGLHYFWVDTCCIDKSNSQELQEAINSMFHWYQGAERCYAYLADVSASTSAGDSERTQRWKPAFKKSRWFTRGWTLQELIAPASVEFFSREGVCLGNKQSLEETLHEITRIALEALRGSPLSQFSTEERLSWAEKRATTREEDVAYCLLGIFDIQMPLLYAEGQAKAMKRLKKEIKDQASDQILSLSEEQKRILLESLRFDQIDARHMTIKNAHVKTCKWLLQSPQYRAWLDLSQLVEHNGFIWIKGKPGTGKSTLMKFALANARRTMKDTIVLSFFFNARGDNMEKSTIGTYRSLLLQLLERIPALQRVFESLGLLASNISIEHQWTVESLETLLEQTIPNLKGSSVVCFIDALDECDEQQIRGMVSFFERVCELAMSSGTHFLVCFSSRHYPYITIQKGLDLVLEGQEGHSQDITNYLESELKIGKSRTAQQIRVELQEKASGVFMWVVLVVGILNKEHDRGRTHALRRRLQEIPKDLHELFHDILTRDSQNKEELALCIQWVLFAKQPLSPEQLYYAILSGIEPDAVSEWDTTEITKADIKRFIIDSSKGLTDITKSNHEKVQFIHESVRDFLLKQNGLGNIWPEYGVNFQGQSYERLKQCCLTYLKWGVSFAPSITDNLTKASSRSDAARFCKEATQTVPFLEYAVQHVLHHADVAEQRGVAQDKFIQDFPLHHWIRLNNLFEKHESRRHTERVSLLYILGVRNMSNLIRARMPVLSCLEVGEERYGPALFASMSSRSNEAVKVFLEALSRDELEASLPQEAYTQYYEGKGSKQIFQRGFVFSKRKGVLSYLVDLGIEPILALVLNTDMVDVEFKDKGGRTPLYRTAENGLKAVVKLLLDKGADPNAQGGHYGNALQVASKGGHEQVVKLLLDKGADPNAQGGHYGNALQAASSGGHEQVVKLLLDKGADPNAQGGHYGNALQAASSGGHQQVVKVLLNKGVDSDTRGGYFGNALQAASKGGHEQVVELLLDKGADPDAQGGEYGNALQAASSGGHEAIIKLLLNKGADPNAQGGHYGNALQAASSGGHKQVVELLLDKGTDPNAQGEHYSNALRIASSIGHEQVAKLLLDKGADPNAQGGHYGNALQVASSRGHEAVVKLLLDKGADLNAQGGHYGNALQAASSRGHKAVVKLLLDKGADPNAQGGYYGNALQAASEGGHEQVVELLLDKGADPDVQGGHYGNALQAASSGGHEVTVKLLLDKGADPNSLGGYYGNALQAASSGGYEATVKLLLDKGADLNTQGGHYYNALQAASKRGHKQVVELLVAMGAKL